MTLLILKPTLDCNAQCLYCSAAHGVAPESMTTETLQRTLSLFGDWALLSGTGRLRLLWHGGEPLLMPPTFWEEVLEGAEILRARGIRVEHSLQTNGTRINRESLPLLKSLLGDRGTLGTSSDPRPGIRELRGRPRGAYYQRWEEAMALLREAGIRYGILIVIHGMALEGLDDLYRHYRTEHPQAGLRFNPLYCQGRAAEALVWDDLGISPEQWGFALRTLHRAWEADGRPPCVQPFAPWDRLHTLGEWRLSCDCSGNCGEQHFGVSPDGRVFLCGRSADGEGLHYGSVFELTAAELGAHPLRRLVTNRRAYLQRTACRDCPWWSYCHGGCVNDGILAHGTAFAPTAFCSGIKNFLEAAYGRGDA